MHRRRLVVGLVATACLAVGGAVMAVQAGSPPPASPTRARLTDQQVASLLQQLSSIPLVEGEGLGFYYDPARDVIVAEGNIDPRRLPQDALAQGQIVFTYGEAGRLGGGR